MNDYTVISYIAYIIIAVPLTIWVANTLHKNGRIFLLRKIDDEALADSINHLLVVGFYLVNIGFVLLYLRQDQTMLEMSSMIELLSAKLGFVMLILGGMHFFNIWLFNKMGRKKDAYQPPKLPAYAGWSKPEQKQGTNM